ncbi:MAG TPA: magnesium/cobalt transporter CorA [bacterium]|nr:magnesium/cobalt transporter CorA [bacterium]
MSIQTVIESRQLTWIDVEAPTHQELAAIGERFGFHELTINDCISYNQRPKLDEYPDHVFVILHFPEYCEDTQRIYTRQISLFLSKRFLVSIHTESNASLEQLIGECHLRENRSKLLDAGAVHLFYLIIDRCMDAAFPVLDAVSASLEKLEEEVFSKPSEQTVQEIPVLRRNIINFRKIIGPERDLIASFEHSSYGIFPEDLDIFFDDILDHIEKIWLTLQHQLETVEGLSTTNDSLLTHRTNETIKFLTIFSALMLPLSVITGLWGMNMVWLPLAGNPFGFWGMLGFMLIVSSLSLCFFKWKKWI